MLSSPRAFASAPKMILWMDLELFTHGWYWRHQYFFRACISAFRHHQMPMKLLSADAGKCPASARRYFAPSCVFCCDSKMFPNQDEAPRSPQPLGLCQVNLTQFVVCSQDSPGVTWTPSMLSLQLQRWVRALSWPSVRAHPLSLCSQGAGSTKPQGFLIHSAEPPNSSCFLQWFWVWLQKLLEVYLKEIADIYV